MKPHQHAGEQTPLTCTPDLAAGPAAGQDPRSAPGPAPDRKPARPDGQRRRVRVGSPDGILAVVPHLLGFHPSSSIVVLGISGPRHEVSLAFRYDLPDPPDHAAAADIAGHAVEVLTRQHITTAVIVGYGPGALVTPVADLLRLLMGNSRLTVRDVLRVEAGRYWSYLCTDPRCCPPDGVPYDALGHPAAAALRDAGLTAQPDRAALARTLAPVPGIAAAMEQAMDRARARADGLIREALAVPGCRDASRLLIDAGRRAVRETVATYRTGGALTDLDQIAWLTLTLSDLRVRDDAWARMDPEHRLAHRCLWTDMVRHAQVRYVPAPASLLAFTAWQSGDGSLASVAIERALAADPGYSMALLLAEALHAGLPPSAARLPMTPDEVAASYASTERRGSGPVSGSRPRARRATRRPAG